MHFVDDIVALPIFASAILVVGTTTGIALAAYFFARWVFGRENTSEARELAGSIIIRISALHGLILALVFAEAVFSTNQVKRAVAQESAALGDVFHDLRRYDAETTLGLRWEIADYADEVVDTEWPLLAKEHRLSQKAWTHWNTAYEDILDLDPQTDRQRALKETIVRRIRVVSELRLTRERAAQETVNPFFMTAAIMGVMLTALSYFTFPPTRVNLILLSIYGAYIGMVIYFVMLFANPFQPPNALKPTGFQQFLTQEVRDLPRP